MTKSPATTPIPIQLSGPEFIAFIFPHLSMPMRGPKCKLGYHRVFNLILWVLYTGMQWKCMPVPRASDGTALIHYTTIYKVFAKWADDGSLDQAFIASVRHLAEQHHLDLNILHGDGTNTVAKKGGDGIGYSGHKHQTGEKIIAIVDNNGFVLAPLPVAPVNEADTVLLPDGLKTLKRVARLTGLKIDGSARVIDGDGQPIPGLYAAGELVGGLFYFNYPGGSGLMNGSVFGRIAGTSAGVRAVQMP